MEKRLRFIESIEMQGSDGHRYRVHAYEHQAAVPWGVEQIWESTGVFEYKLGDSGNHVRVTSDGHMTVEPTGVALTPEETPSDTRQMASIDKMRASLPEHTRA